ncbi:hypothetical protein [Paraburkholderia youngii]|uniref:Uncharacterized protein n=1 Tax=Paraburkholderia youngii TaxID=2782701 RepID=A0ABX2NPL0_9BURK|nr:hypothetical protein [Paraburkholderia youngii]NVI06382.1 hypothetical protein [Paraburkholderia youngii]
MKFSSFLVDPIHDLSELIGRVLGNTHRAGQFVAAIHVIDQRSVSVKLPESSKNHTHSLHGDLQLGKLDYCCAWTDLMERDVEQCIGGLNQRIQTSVQYVSQDVGGHGAEAFLSCLCLRDSVVNYGDNRRDLSRAFESVHFECMSATRFHLTPTDLERADDCTDRANGLHPSCPISLTQVKYVFHNGDQADSDHGDHVTPQPSLHTTPRNFGAILT